jgi:hypothetical protein
LHSSHETLNGREVFCRLRLPVPSSPSASEASSSLQISSSLRSAAFPGESSLPGVRLVLVDMVVGGAGQKEPRGREARGFIAFARPLQPRTHAPSAPELAATGRQTCRAHSLFTTRATLTDADSAWADYLLTEHVMIDGRWRPTSRSPGKYTIQSSPTDTSCSLLSSPLLFLLAVVTIFISVLDTNEDPDSRVESFWRTN